MCISLSFMLEKALWDSGLSLDVADVFDVNHVANDNGISGLLEKYTDNYFDILLSYQPSEKFKFQFDYSNYDLEYDTEYDENQDYRDRNDNSIDLYVFFKIKPKTSIFAEYGYSDIRFDTNKESDSTEDRLYGGIDWDITGKTKGRLKAGYIWKDFERWYVDDQEGFSFQAQVQHNFSPKRALILEGFRSYNESNFAYADTFMGTGVSATLLQRFNDKWSGTLEGSYTENDYKGAYSYEDVTKERQDEIFKISPALRYEFREWLFFDLGYTYTNRDSNIYYYDYVDNTVFFRADFFL